MVLATAYYLGKNYGIKNVAIIEKGWLGGGNTGGGGGIQNDNSLTGLFSGNLRES